MDIQILTSAYQYAKMGLPIIACCDVDHKCNVNMEKHSKMCRCQGKAPIIKWRDKTETTTQEVTSWRQQFGEFNLGLPMGSVTGYIGIDIDGPGGEALFKQLCDNRTLPDTWQFTTGEGRRLLFQIPGNIPTKKYCLTDPENKHSECAILCDGQFSVIPPSKHVSGKTYQWVGGASPDTCDCAMAPKWLLDLVRADAPDAVKRAVKSQETFVLNLESEAKPAFAEKMADFMCTPFSAEIPDEILDAKEATVKPGKKESKQKETSSKKWREMLLPTFTISEGGRDNALAAFIGSLLSEDSFRAAGIDVVKSLADKFNQEHLDPPMDQEAVDIKIQTFWEKEQTKSAAYAQKAANKEPFRPFVIYQALKNRLSDEGITYVFDRKQGQSYYFTNGKGPWILDEADTQISNMITDLVLSPPYMRDDWVRVGSIKETISIMSMRESQGMDVSKPLFIDDQSNKKLQQYLPVDGKLLDWKTGEIIPWEKDFFSLANFDVNYDPEATCPHWRDYLEQWLPNESQRVFLQEFLGCAMLPLPDQEARFIILVGSGSNGKSMCLDAIENLFGPTMSTSQELGRLTKDQFGTAKLYGKRLNICSELTESDGYIKDASIMKRLVSGETINIERKGKDGFDYKPIASHIFSANIIPKTRDKSDGWFRRQIVIPFEQKFQANEGVKAVMEHNIQSERAGIFNWLLEGLRRKTARGHYVIPQELQTVQHQIRLEQDPLLNFVSIFLTIGEGITTKEAAKNFLSLKHTKTRHGVSSAILHGLYKAWYMLNISDKTTGMAIKSFQTQFKERYGIEVASQCYSIGKPKMTSVLLGVDFTYSQDMLDQLENILESNALNTMEAATAAALQILIAQCKQYLSGEKITD